MHLTLGKVFQKTEKLYDKHDRWKELVKIKKKISKSHYNEDSKNQKYTMFNRGVNKNKLNSFNLSTLEIFQIAQLLISSVK